jgi:hypothetical protein
MASRMTLNLRDPDIAPHSTEAMPDSTPESDQVISTILTLGQPSYAESSLRSRSEAESSMIALRRMETRDVV